MKLEIGRVINKVLASFSFMLFECICVVFGSLIFAPLEDRTLGGSEGLEVFGSCDLEPLDKVVKLFVHLSGLSKDVILLSDKRAEIVNLSHQDVVLVSFFGKRNLSFGKLALHSLHIDLEACDDFVV